MPVIGNRECQDIKHQSDNEAKRISMNDDLCDTCRKSLNDIENSIPCESCKKRQHFECTGLTRGEFDIAKRKNCKLTWLCSDCKPKILRTADIEARLADKLKTQIEVIMMEMRCGIEDALREEIKTSIRQELKQHQQRPTVIKPRAPKPTTEKEGKSHQASTSNEETDTTNEQPTGEDQHITREQQLTQEITMDETKTDDKSQEAVAPNGNTNNQLNGNHREEQGNWIEARRRKINTRITGTRETRNNLRAADRKAWLYVGRLHQSVEQEDLIIYLEENGIRGKIECEELNVMGANRAFRVGIPYELKDRAEQPQFWPEGVVVRQYLFRRSQREGARLH